MATVKINGEDHEVEIADITLAVGEVPEGFVTAAKMTSTVAAATARQAKSTRAALEADDAFKTTILAGYGVTLREDGSVSGAPKDTAALEASWKARHLDPVSAQLQQSKDATARYRTQTLGAAIVAAATEAGVRPAFLKPAPGQTTAPIVAMTQGSFAFDEASDTFAVREGDGFRYASGGALAGPGDLFAGLRGDVAYADYFTPTGMAGSGHSKTPPGSGAGRTYTTAEVNQLASTPESWATHQSDVKAALAEGRVRD